MAEVDEKKLEAIVANQIALAKDFDTRERDGDRSKALDYFFGKMDAYVPPEENRSKSVSRDVADTMGWMLPGIMRVFTASDNMAEAEPVGVEDVAFARQATDGINHAFWKDNPGYQIVYSVTWDSLLTGNGIVKAYFDPTPETKTSIHTGLGEEQLVLLLMPDEGKEPPEVMAQTANVMMTVDPTTGQQQEVVTYDVKIRREIDDGRFVIEVIPPEHFLIDAEATTIDDAAFTAHWERKTRSDLVAMGYDVDEVREIPVASNVDTAEEVSRGDSITAEATDASMEKVDYYECFLHIDVDDDGEAEFLRVCYAGGKNGKLLDWEVWEDEHPFTDIPCDPIPHRWQSKSIADETMDVQDVKTVLLRQFLNNIYASNNPQRFAKGKIENPEELTSPTFGGVVFSKDANASVETLKVPFVAEQAVNGLKYQDEVVQRRTGVGRGTMALDPEALQNQTAEAVREGKDSSYSQIELVARNMAEWGWKRFFRKLLRLLIKHQGPRTLMVNGQSSKIDPRFWNADMDITINVGLGSGSRDRDMKMLGYILETQQKLAEWFVKTGAMEQAIDMLPKIIQTMTRIAESAGIRNPQEYYPADIDNLVKNLKQLAANKAKQGDPKIAAETAKAKADLQLKAQQVRIDAQIAEQKVSAESQRSKQQYALKRDQLAAEMQLKREELQAEFDLKRTLAIEELRLKQELALASARLPAVPPTVSDVHMGGEPG